MKSLLLTLLSFAASAQQLLTTAEFAQKTESIKNVQLIDVRTPEEFDKGHIKKAYNMDFNGSQFKTEIGWLRKDIPVLVYCLSGGRSAQAVALMKAAGVKEIYELKGGYMKWIADKKEVVGQNQAIQKASLTHADVAKLNKENKMVVLDFYADWCGPCKKMDPTLKKLESEMAGKVKFQKVNADLNAELVKQYAIDEIPTFIIFKNGVQKMRASGYMDEPHFKALLADIK